MIVGESIENPSFQVRLISVSSGAPIEAPENLRQRRNLLDPGATPLDQDHQHENKEYTGNNPDNCGAIHFPTLLSTTKFAASSARFLRIRPELRGKILYLTRVRRRWTRMPKTRTKSTPATTRIISVLSMAKSPFV
jgi:hypothetical protein